MMSRTSKEKSWHQSNEDLQRSRQKIQTALKVAKERSKKNVNLEDDIDTKFNQLQTLGFKLLDILKETGLEQLPEWIQLTESMCQLLAPLKGSMPFMSSSEEREIRSKDLLYRQKSMMDLTRVIGQKLLFDGKHNQAVPAAIQSLRFSIDVHGLNSVNLVPSYLILGEASIGLGKLSQADEYLAQAEWTVLKALDVTDGVKSKLYRNIAMLYTTKGDHENALRLLAEDIYHASSFWGTKHILTAGGYFHMANVFFRQNKMDIADSLYYQVTDAWFMFLSDAVAKKTALPSPAGLLVPDNNEQPQEISLIDKAQESEAIQMLNAVFDICEQSSKPNFETISKICHTLYMLYFIVDDLTRAQEFGRKYKAACERLPPDSEIAILPDYFKTTNNNITSLRV